MSKFSNIEEWVARRVIFHMKYRDEEVAKLKRIIEDIDTNNFNKCENCHEYEETINMKICNWCWFRVCYKCADLVLFEKGKNRLCMECIEYCECYSSNLEKVPGHFELYIHRSKNTILETL